MRDPPAHDGVVYVLFSTKSYYLGKTMGIQSGVLGPVKRALDHVRAIMRPKCREWRVFCRGMLTLGYFPVTLTETENRAKAIASTLVSMLSPPANVADREADCTRRSLALPLRPPHGQTRRQRPPPRLRPPPKTTSVWDLPLMWQAINKKEAALDRVEAAQATQAAIDHSRHD